MKSKIQVQIEDKEVIDSMVSKQEKERYPRLLSDEISVESAPSVSRWAAIYDPAPVVEQSTILMAGFVLFVLAQIWPPLILLVAYFACKLIPYSFRENDDPATRRRLWAEFVRDDDLPEDFINPPGHIDVQHGFWTNRR